LKSLKKKKKKKKEEEEEVYVHIALASKVLFNFHHVAILASVQLKVTRTFLFGVLNSGVQ
jgi:hypothetical protein